MTITVNDVRVWLDPEEPDYEAAAQALGDAAQPALLQLVQGADLALASKATYLASLLPGGVPAMKAAHARNEPLLKVAAASGLRNLRADAAADLFDVLHADADPGVRKVALRSAVGLAVPRVQDRLRQMAQGDPEPFVRETAARVMERDR